MGSWVWMPINSPLNVHDYYHYRFQVMFLDELGYDDLYPCLDAALPASFQIKQYRSQKTYLPELSEKPRLFRAGRMSNIFCREFIGEMY